MERLKLTRARFWMDKKAPMWGFENAMSRLLAWNDRKRRIKSMDPAVWSKLPLEILLFQVFPRLPFLYRLRLRCICRYWSTLLISKPYHTYCIDKFPSSDLSALLRVSSLTYYEFRLWWCKTPIKSILPRNIEPRSYLPLSCEEGIICFQYQSSSDPSEILLAMYNPILNQWMDLPGLLPARTPEKPSTSLSLRPSIILKEGSGFFLIVAAGKSYVFDSATRRWDAIPLDSFVCDKPYSTSTSMVIGGIAYILISACSGERKVLAKYDPACQKLSKCDFPDDEMCLDLKARVSELDGQVVLFGFKQEGGFCLWMFDIGTLKWSVKHIGGPPWDIGKYSQLTDFDIHKKGDRFYFHHNVYRCYFFAVAKNTWFPTTCLCKSDSSWYQGKTCSYKPGIHSLFDAASRKPKRKAKVMNMSGHYKKSSKFAKWQSC